ncbi:MAG: glycine betaine ABC transporter substrate-binding protein [Gemmataceae bacterium]
MIRFSWIVGTVALLAGCQSRDSTAPPVKVGSKAFTESVILGELVRHLAESTAIPAVHHARLGDTSKAWEALLAGELDAYVEYTGTLTQEILAAEKPQDPPALRAALARRGLRMSEPLGFRNNYALGMREAQALELDIHKISDLTRHPMLRLGLSHAFLERADGWPGLKRRYSLPFSTPRGMEHSLAYQGLVNQSLDVIDLYTTDAEIIRYGLRVLEDDRRHFPAYEAVLLYREDLASRAPRAVEAMLRLQGLLDEKQMQELNFRASVDHVPETVVAADFLADRLKIAVNAQVESLGERLLRTTREHLFLVMVSLVGAVVVAVPLGVAASRHALLGQMILALVGMVQTFPSLALLSLLIILLRQIGAVPAIVALFIYSLLPIVRNTHTGLLNIPLSLRESASAMGLTGWSRLTLIDLPLASRNILAGIKTAAVINVGYATLGGLIGAGGYGQPIISGLDKNNYHLILEGAIPAVLMALLVQAGFELAERWLVPRGLMLEPAK